MKQHIPKMAIKMTILMRICRVRKYERWVEIGNKRNIEEQAKVSHRLNVIKNRLVKPSGHVLNRALGK